MEPITENPNVGDCEMWEFYNTTGDAHPMHVHEVLFQVVNREGLVLDGDDVAVPIELDGVVAQPEAWEDGWKDTVIAYPGQVTPIRAQFTSPGQFVLALPHRRTRRQRDDAALPHWSGAARPARLETSGAVTPHPAAKRTGSSTRRSSTTPTSPPATPRTSRKQTIVILLV